MASWRKIHKAYDRLRLRYFMEPGEYRVPPPAAAIRWAWIDSKTEWGYTLFNQEDDDHDVELVAIHKDLREARCFGRLVLMHELSHMRNPKAACGRSGRYWREEEKRLAQLGAFSRELIF